MQSPYTLWLHVRELVQLERITFRADLLSEEICSSYCSESDTFLMNYIIKDSALVLDWRLGAPVKIL